MLPAAGVAAVVMLAATYLLALLSALTLMPWSCWHNHSRRRGQQQQQQHYQLVQGAAQVGAKGHDQQLLAAGKRHQTGAAGAKVQPQMETSPQLLWNQQPKW